ncbi:YibE/F family protein, partial [Staphylococcus caprae]
IFAQEFISILLGGIAVAISIPITAWLTAILIKRQKTSTTQNNQQS